MSLNDAFSWKKCHRFETESLQVRVSIVHITYNRFLGGSTCYVGTRGPWMSSCPGGLIMAYGIFQHLRTCTLKRLRIDILCDECEDRFYPIGMPATQPIILCLHNPSTSTFPSKLCLPFPVNILCMPSYFCGTHQMSPPPHPTSPPQLEAKGTVNSEAGDTIRREREEERRLLADTHTAAMDLRTRLEHSERDWMREKSELLERFDLERKEWESQLRDMQHKIEEVSLQMETKPRKQATTPQRSSKRTNYALLLLNLNTFLENVS